MAQQNRRGKLPQLDLKGLADDAEATGGVEAKRNGKGTRGKLEEPVVMELDRDDLFYELVRAVQEDNVVLLGSLLQIVGLSDVCQLDPRLGSVSYGTTPLHLCRSASTASLLLDFGVPVDIEGACNSTALITCCKYPRVVSLLLKRGAKLEHCTHEGSTALHHAVLNDALESAKILVKAGADVNRQDKSGNAAMHMVGTLDMAKFLLANGANPTMVNNEDKIPLEEAVAKGRHFSCMEVAAFLLDVSETSNRTRTQQLLDALTSHVLQVGKETEAKVFEDGTVIPIRTHDSGESSCDEEKVAFESHESYDARDKWRAVKRRVFGGKVKLVKFRQTKDGLKEWATGRRAAFARRSHSLDEKSRSAKAEFFLSFFELMVKEQPSLAARILDRQRELLYQRHGCKTYAYSFDLIGTPLRTTSAVKAMVKYNRYELVAHPVVQWQITAKFILLTRYLLYFEFVLSSIFALLILVTFSAERNHLSRWSAALLGGGALTAPSQENAEAAGMMLLEVALLGLNTRFLLTHLVHWRSATVHIKSRKERFQRFFKGCEDSLGSLYVLPHWLIFAREYITNSESSESSIQLARVLSAVAFFAVFIRCFSYAEGLYEGFGLTICTIRRMFLDCQTYFQVLVAFIVAFAAGLTTLYSGSEVKEFNSFGSSCVSLFIFVFNFDAGSVIDDPFVLRRVSALVFLGVYMILVVLTMVNLIIAVYSNTYEEISVQALEQSVLTRAKFVITMEEHSGVFSAFAQRFMRKCCPKAGRWFDWEKQNFMGRKVFVREYPSGRTDIETTQSILNYLYAQRCPPYFLEIARLYENTSCIISPMPNAERFSWKLMRPVSKCRDIAPPPQPLGLYGSIGGSSSTLGAAPDELDHAAAERSCFIAKSTRSRSTAVRKSSLGSDPGDAEAVDVEAGMGGDDDPETVYVGYFMRLRKDPPDAGARISATADEEGSGQFSRQSCRPGSPRGRARSSSGQTDVLESLGHIEAAQNDVLTRLLSLERKVDKAVTR